ncbi:Serine/threonine-protein kinase ICK [Phytophthora citrophthora]|uniref:Serine/threonine-protein kinase ICK n=1 Tax=Phytophthora citrophthora TaxID=4793 RepID=A0AAD9H069_9STRA|nr:Serine/threonine-protein kinase ICK [Phytophthora citrophthora]
MYSQDGDDEDDEELELDWDDIDDLDEAWELNDEGDVASSGRRKVEEHVKRKVSVRRAQHSKRRFVDRIRVKATGGHGGNGCASFFSESAMRKRPNGGHGGAGGDVVIEASDKKQNLGNATHHFKGGSGTNGMSNDAAGRRGKHCHVKVPCGTLVKRVERYERELDNGEWEIVDKMQVVADLDKHGASFLAAKGGKPGLGNRILAGKTTKFGSLRKFMPENKTTGSPGLSQYYELELKTIADVGLVGYPNAGKSTLLSVLSRATPEIAPYPFTTLHPYVGIVEFPDTFRLSVADIPGLIDGAHRNVGLGHDFLRHIERTKILMYVLDTAGSEGRDPMEDFTHLQKELELYAPGISSRPSLIIANKMDEEGKCEHIPVVILLDLLKSIICAEDNFHKLRESTDLAVLPVSLKAAYQQSWRLHKMNRYEILDRVGDGAFGEVSRARSLKTQEIVAVKKIKALFPTWEECLQLRELKSLRVLRHENIVLLKEVIRDKEELYFVFEYLQTSLFRVMRNLKNHGGSNSSSVGAEANSSSEPSSLPHPWFSNAQVRSIMFQLFSGLAYMHKHGYFHRDIKPENLLCHDDTLKIADLGQAREIRSRPPFTDYVSTRWYRAPELLLRSTTYNSPIDLWACGCILVELLVCSPLFPGTSEADQLYRICKVLGPPTKETWPEGAAMASQMHVRLPKCAPVSWKRFLPQGTPSSAVQLVQDLLQFDPSRRITAAQALQHRFFEQTVTRPTLTITPLLMPEEEVPVLPIRSEYKSMGGYSSYTGRSNLNLCTKKSDEVPMSSAETSSLWAGGSLTSRHENHLWTAKERLQTHTRHQEWGSALVSARPGGLDDISTASIQSRGGSFTGSMVKKSSSYNMLVGEGDDSFYSARKCTPDTTNEDDGKSDSTLLQDLLDEILG